MKDNIYCDECKSEFTLNEISIEENTLKKAGKIEKIKVQYFRCPTCFHKYIIAIFDDDINKLNAEYDDFLQNHDKVSFQKFEAKINRMRHRIVAEESMLMHLYRKQHKDNAGLVN